MDMNIEFLNYIYQNAEMLIQGSTMGIVNVTKKLKQYIEAHKDISALANRLLVFEQQNVEEMKKFL